MKLEVFFKGGNAPFYHHNLQPGDEFTFPPESTPRIWKIRIVKDDEAKETC